MRKISRLDSPLSIKIISMLLNKDTYTHVAYEVGVLSYILSVTLV